MGKCAIERADVGDIWNPWGDQVGFIETAHSSCGGGMQVMVLQHTGVYYYV